MLTSLQFHEPTDDLAEPTDICTLLDTGNFSHSFIQRTHLTDDQLARTKRTIAQTVKMGDGESSVNLDEYILSTVSLPLYGTEDRHLIPDLKLMITDKLSFPVILSCSDLVRKAPVVFMSHFLAAIKDSHKLDAVMEFLEDSYINSHNSHTACRVGSGTTTQRSTEQPLTAPMVDNAYTILALNVNGIRSALDNGLTDLISAQQPDIFVATELKLSQKHIASVKTIFAALFSSVEVYTSGTSAGILVATNMDSPAYVFGMPHVDPTNEEARLVTLGFQDPPITLLCTYVPFNNPNVPNRDISSQVFRSNLITLAAQMHPKRSQRSKHVLIVGDLQVAPTALDESIPVPESPGSTSAERADFQSLINLGYVDTFRHLHPNRREYTVSTTYPAWNLPHESKMAHKRIDHILATAGITPINFDIIAIPPTVSDHQATLLKFQVAKSIYQPRPRVKRKPVTFSNSSPLIDDTIQFDNDLHQLQHPDTSSTAVDAQVVAQSKHLHTSRSRSSIDLVPPASDPSPCGNPATGEDKILKKSLPAAGGSRKFFETTSPSSPTANTGYTATRRSIQEAVLHAQSRPNVPSFSF